MPPSPKVWRQQLLVARQFSISILRTHSEHIQELLTKLREHLHTLEQEQNGHSTSSRGCRGDSEEEEIARLNGCLRSATDLFYGRLQAFLVEAKENHRPPSKNETEYLFCFISDNPNQANRETD